VRRADTPKRFVQQRAQGTVRRIGTHSYLPLGRLNALPNSALRTVVPEISCGPVVRPRMKRGSLHKGNRWVVRNNVRPLLNTGSLRKQGLRLGYPNITISKQRTYAGLLLLIL
jgi:hypothetical protein